MMSIDNIVNLDEFYVKNDINVCYVRGWIWPIMSVKQELEELRGHKVGPDMGEREKISIKETELLQQTQIF